MELPDRPAPPPDLRPTGLNPLRSTGSLDGRASLAGLESRTTALLHARAADPVRTAGMPDGRPADPGNAQVSNAQAEERAEEICSRLLIERWLPKRAYRDLLLDDDLRGAVARRLAGVGLELVESFTSDFFAVRLKREVESDIAFDWATNTRMPRGAVALLVVLWAKLVLPKRTQAADDALDRQVRVARGAAGPLPEGDAAASAPAPPPPPAASISVERDALYAEFGRKFGKTAFARFLGQLKAAGFVREDRQGHLREGPLLDLLVDGVQMAQKLRDSVLWDVIERGGDVGTPGEGADREPSTDAEDLQIEDLDGDDGAEAA
ncbi:MAG: hypothetical protein EXR79_16970 [Myxococcales bacterium]|nr:hypothetical protein [Myxococcales bacterium]